MKESRASTSVLSVPVPACWKGTGSWSADIARKKAIVFLRCSRVSWVTCSLVARPGAFVGM